MDAQNLPRTRSDHLAPLTGPQPKEKTMPEAPPIRNWRAKAKELAAVLAALPTAVRQQIEDTLDDAVLDIHQNMATDVNDAGPEEQFLCLFDDDSPESVEKWLNESIAFHSRSGNTEAEKQP